MDTKPTLEQLKKQVETTSNKFLQEYDAKMQIYEDFKKSGKLSKEFEEEIKALKSSFMEKSILIDMQDKELLQDKLDKIYFKQQQQLEQLKQLNNNIAILVRIANK